MVDKYIQGLIDREPPDSPVKYQFLDRMRFDCNYLTGDSGPKYRIHKKTLLVFSTGSVF